VAKKIEKYIKLQVPAGSANPSPPVGPALGQHGLNIMEFCKAFNAQTQDVENGMPLPVVIAVYTDKSFTFEIKTPPAAVCGCSNYCWQCPQYGHRRGGCVTWPKNRNVLRRYAKKLM
jgi:hypothetical protein